MKDYPLDHRREEKNKILIFCFLVVITTYNQSISNVHVLKACTVNVKIHTTLLICPKYSIFCFYFFLVIKCLFDFLCITMSDPGLH